MENWSLFSSVAQLCPTLCDLMDCNTPALPVHHQLLEFTQTHLYWVSDAIQPSHPLSSPSPPIYTLSQLQGLFQLVSSSHQVAKVWGFIPSTHIVLFFSTFSQILSSSYWITQAWKYAFTQAYSHHPLYSSIPLLSLPPLSYTYAEEGRYLQQKGKEESSFKKTTNSCWLCKSA